MSLSCLGICLNHQNLGLSQYLAFNFNSMTVFNGVPIGASEDGIFALDGDNDNGADIDALVELPNTDLGTDKQKRVRQTVLGYEAAGDLSVAVTLDETTSQTKTLSQNVETQVQQTGRVPLDRTAPGRYVQLKIENVDGCDFALDQVEIDPVILNRRPR